MPVVDIHAHFLPPEWPDLAERFSTPGWPWLRHTGPGRGMLMLGEREFRPVTEASWNPARRLEDMDRDGVDMQVICATPVLFGYERPAEQALDCARLFNDAALELAAHAPQRLFPLCQVPLQDTDRACREVERCLAQGHKGVQIGNHVGNRNLDDAAIITFLHHCADIGAAVLVHPWDMLGRERMPRYMLQWLVAMPAETQLGILSLVLSGAFEKLPATLRLCFAHGGGSFAFLLGRVDNAWRHRDIVREDCPHLPSSYVERFAVDSAVFDPGALALLVEVMGPRRVLLGSDYPFPLGEQRVGALVREHAGLDEVAKRRILGANAVEFFALD